jgi:2-haloacid dehalogenase
MSRSPQKYQWLFFDADGTLFDFDRAEAKALEYSFRDFNLDYISSYGGVYQQINQQVWQDFELGKITSAELRIARFERLFQALDIQADAKVFSARYLIHLGNAAELIEGAGEIVRLLQEKYHLVLVTNGIKEVQRSRLAQSTIADCFELVAISEEIGAAKPDPHYFAAVFNQLGSPSRESVLVIGDSLTSDIQGGINYELDTCWYNPQNRPANPLIQPTYQIKTLEELHAVLNQAVR